MAPSRKSQYIQQGTYLANRDSVASYKEIERSNASPRSLPEPRGIEAGLPYPAETYMDSQDDLSKLAVLRQCTNWYHGDQTKAARRLGIGEPTTKRSRLSFTPAMFQLGTGALSAEQTRELARVYTDTASELSEKQVDACTEPPDGGLLAWAHAAAGHLVAFNVQ